MRRLAITAALLALAAVVVLPLSAQNSPGAIFTTLPDGSEVNYNIYDQKSDVYLDGGPGPGAPQTAAGLSDGTYIFMVTDPPGKTLLSTDPVGCRQFTISNGIITGVVPFGGCEHLTGLDVDHGAATVQLCNRAGCQFGFLDTPNHGGEYKAWVESVSCWVNAGCDSTLNSADCRAGRHGFIRGCYTKSDNFKVGGQAKELDTRFFNDANHNGVKDSNEDWIDGLGIVWFDTVGNNNNKWSYLNTALDINHEAHIETPETGTHQVVLTNQPGCNIGNVFLNGTLLSTTGPQTVSVKVGANFKAGTLRIDVACE